MLSDVRKNPAFRGTPPAFGRSRSSTIIVFLMKINDLSSFLVVFVEELVLNTFELGTGKDP